MTTTMYVVPAQGRVVRDPTTRKPIPATGAKVPTSSYWLRRVHDGDVLVTPAPKPETAKKSGGVA